MRFEPNHGASGNRSHRALKDASWRSRPSLRILVTGSARQAALRSEPCQTSRRDHVYQTPGALLPVTGRRVAGPLAKLAPPAMQHIGIDFPPRRHFSDRNALFQTTQCRHLNSLVNILLDNPMTQFGHSRSIVVGLVGLLGRCRCGPNTLVRPVRRTRGRRALHKVGRDRVHRNA